MILAYLRSQCRKFHEDGCHAQFLCPFIWSRLSGLMRFCNGSDKGTAIKCRTNLGKSASETLAMIIQAFGGESMSHTWEVQIHKDQ
jgi:hypothetical protein